MTCPNHNKKDDTCVERGTTHTIVTALDLRFCPNSPYENAHYSYQHLRCPQTITLGQYKLHLQ
jgi:hypothetical protein